MQHQITIREAVADADIARFWEQLYRYYARDILQKRAVVSGNTSSARNITGT